MRWTRDSVRLVDDRNPQRLRQQPLGVYRSRRADRVGRDIFFVAAARAIGIPARINEVNAKVQYLADGQWVDVHFAPLPTPNPAPPTPNSPLPTTHPVPPTPQGTLLLRYTPTSHTPDAKYYTHFTLARLDSANRLQLLTYPEDATYRTVFADGVALDTGTYVLTTGTRLADGSVLSRLQSFRIRAGQTTQQPLLLRHRPDAVQVIGALNAEDPYRPLAFNPGGTEPQPATSILSTTGRGYYILGLIAPGHEPTNHTLRDIALVRADLEAWGRPLLLLLDSEEAAERFNFKEFWNVDAAAPLPATTVWGIDPGGAIRAEVIEQLHLPTAAAPIFVVADSFNRVVFVHQGYTIGLGEQLLKVIKQL